MWKYEQQFFYNTNTSSAQILQQPKCFVFFPIWLKLNKILLCKIEGKWGAIIFQNKRGKYMGGDWSELGLWCIDISLVYRSITRQSYVCLAKESQDTDLCVLCEVFIRRFLPFLTIWAVYKSQSVRMQCYPTGRQDTFWSWAQTDRQKRKLVELFLALSRLNTQRPGRKTRFSFSVRKSTFFHFKCKESTCVDCIVLRDNIALSASE